EVAVDDDEGHADGHDAEACGVAQHARQGRGIAEESRVDPGADEVKHGHEDEQAEFPGAENARDAPGHRRHITVEHGPPPPPSPACGGGRRAAARGWGYVAVTAISSRTACRRCRRWPW